MSPSVVAIIVSAPGRRLACKIGRATGYTGSGFRGGSWNNNDNKLQVSDRNNATNTNPNRNNNNGWRAVRSVP